MKKKVLVLGVIMSSMLAWTGCTKEELIGSMTATIDGTTWVATGQVAAKVQNRVVITGTSGKASIVLSPNGITVGNYSTDVFSGNVQPFVFTPDVTNAHDIYVGTGGSINITSYSNNRLSGNFNVSAANAVPAVKNISGEFKNILIN